MKVVMGGLVAVAATAGTALAGGLDRTGQSVGVIFEEGRYAEFSFGGANPSVSGIEVNPTLGLDGFQPSGSVSPSFRNFGAAYKDDISEHWSYAIIYDQPFGAAVDYPTGTGYFAEGAVAEFGSQALTGVLQYNLANNGSVFAGLRLQEVEATATIPFIPGGGYDVVGAPDWGTGYLVGVAYEKPEIALRVALTYNSEVEHSLDTVETSGLGTNPSSTEIVTPQSINLEFQSGIAADTLLFGSARWVEWGNFTIAPADYSSNLLTGGPLVAYAGDYTTWTLGIGRRLNETWSVAASLGYEEPVGEIVNNLGPTDGFKSIGFGATYTQDNVKVTGGIRFVDVGDASTTSPFPPPPASEFEGNTAIAAGIKIGFNF